MKAGVSCFLGSGDVVWAASWLGWIANDGWKRPVTQGVPRRSTKSVRVSRFLALPPDTKRPSSCLKTVTISRSLKELAREVAFKASPLAKRRTAKPPTKAGHCLCRSPHGWYLDYDSTVRSCLSITWCVEMDNRKSRSKSCKDSRSETELSNHSRVVPRVRAEAHASSGRRCRNGRCFGRVL